MADLANTLVGSFESEDVFSTESSSGAQTPLLNQSEIDTVYRTVNEQYHIIRGDTTIWDVDENGNTETPKYKTNHNR